MMKIRSFTCMFCCVCLLAFNPGLILAAPETTRVSVNTSGGEPDFDSYSSAVSYSGRYVAFSSNATNLVSPPDADTVDTDIFLWDRINKTTERVSVKSSGGEPNGQSWGFSISADGRYVAFQSNATDLLDPPDNLTNSDIFVRDMKLTTTERVSVSFSGGEPNMGSYDPSISEDGRYVAFTSNATDLLQQPDTKGFGDIFVRDRIDEKTERISVQYNTASGEPDYHSRYPAISADGRFVAFESEAKDLLQAIDTLSHPDIFVWDRIDQKTERISVKHNTSNSEPNGRSMSPSISGDGRYVAFSSEASDLVASDTNGIKDIFVFDRQTKTTELISINNAGEQQTCSSANSWEDGGYAGALSTDGRYVAFISNCPNLVEGDTNDTHDLFRRDRQKKVTIRTSVNTAGQQQNGAVHVEYDSFAISGNGQFMTFRSSSTNLVDPGDQLAFDDIFLREEKKDFSWPLFLPRKKQN